MKRISKKKINKLLDKLIVFLFLLVLFALIRKDINKPSGNEIVKENLEVYFFDVGQADSTLIKQGEYTMLIDAGNNEDGINLVNYLKEEIEVEDIDVLVGTHPHEDHIGGMNNIIDELDIGKIYMPNVTTNTATFNEVLDSIKNKNYNISIPKIGEVIELGDMVFEVMYVGEEESDLNNSSIVLRLDFGNTSYLFMGDATSKVEKKLLDDNIEVDVLKVGHHGSKYSTSNNFLDKVSPKYAIIEVGKNNDYGHPSNETIEKFTKKGIKIYRTDLDGTVKLTSDGKNIDFTLLETDIDG